MQVLVTYKPCRNLRRRPGEANVQAWAQQKTIHENSCYQARGGSVGSWDYYTNACYISPICRFIRKTNDLLVRWTKVRTVILLIYKCCQYGLQVNQMAQHSYHNVWNAYMPTTFGFGWPSWVPKWIEGSRECRGLKSAALLKIISSSMFTQRNKKREKLEKGCWITGWKANG